MSNGARRGRSGDPHLTGRVPLERLGQSLDPGTRAHYEDAAYYDKTYRKRSEDVAYYERIARLFGGPVLEYGVGSGRIALPLARAGIEVVGVDTSKPMLATLKQRLAQEPKVVRDKLELVRGDMRRVELNRRFPLVLCTFNTILHLYERRDVERFLARVREHLTPRGRFVFDFSMPHAADLDLDPERRYASPRFRHPSSGELTRYFERFEYDPLRQLLLIEMQFESLESSKRWITPLTHRQFYPREMEALLHYNGFGDIIWTRDFLDLPPDDETDSLVVNCRIRRDFIREAGTLR